jgi:hypothetical protein
MTNNFQSLSNEIANDFLQSVIFIDDKAYKDKSSGDPRHDFDAQEITMAFAKERKICAVYQPMSKKDIESLTVVMSKADVTVIDWEIIIPESTNTIEQGNDDDDDDDDELKGKYTKDLIIGSLNSPSKRNSIKLIVIYTGETDLEGISKSILDDLKANNINGFSVSDNDDYCIQSLYCKIIIRAKANGGADRGKYLPSLKNKKLTYQEIPSFIVNEFSKMTAGLMSNFALKSLTAIRKNSHQILNIFSKKLDTAYLTNQSLLVNTDDANELLVELLGDTFTSILRANNLNQVIDDNFIYLWLEENIKNTNKPIYSKKGIKTSDSYILDKDIIKDLLKSHSDVEKKFSDVLTKKDNISKSTLEEKDNYKKYALDLFHTEDKKESMNVDFTNLCQHKNLVHHEEHIPSLSLGTIVKSSVGVDNYLVCIQQRCDSVRIKATDVRRFLFLSLSATKGNKKFDFITPNGQKITLDRKTFHLRTVKFSGSANGTVKAEDNEGCFLFKQIHASEEVVETFEFVFELKDIYAQRVVADYSASLSRVGLDEPEWVRLS